MIKSMTGYGKAEVATENKKFTAEIRSLNSKQLDLSVKMPATYRQCEYDIRNTVSKVMQRGKIDLFISVENMSNSTAVVINRDLFGLYYKQLTDIASANGMDRGSDNVDSAILTAVLRMPEVVQTETAVIPEEEIAAIMSAVIEALDHWETFRRQEGTILITDLLERIGTIESLRKEIEPFESLRAETIKNRIREHIESLGLTVDNNRLEQEMVYYIEKLDITEETIRLDNHCKYFREVAAEEDGVGRKLGFISQEIGREINTLGSKANDSSMQRIVVQMKDELEKIKEQVLNIL